MVRGSSAALTSTSADETHARLQAQVPSRQPGKTIKTFVTENAGPYRALLQSYPRHNRQIAWDLIVRDVGQQLDLDLSKRRRTLQTYLSSADAGASERRWLKARSGMSGLPDHAPSPTLGQSTNPFKGER